MDLISIPMLELLSEEDLKERLKFYTESTISKDNAEVELECLLTNKEYNLLIRILYG